MCGRFAQKEALEKLAKFYQTLPPAIQFNGNYNVSIIDMSGKVLAIKNIDLSNVQSFRFDFGTMLTNGKYMITVQKKDGEQKGLIQLEKL